MFTINTNIDELLEKFKKLQGEIGGIDFSGALLVGVNAAIGQMTFRIFNKGQDTVGLDFGKYTGKRTGISKRSRDKFSKLKIAEAFNFDAGLTAYERKRLKKGRQINYKDLEFTGDLRKAIVPGVESFSKVICWIPNDQLYKIARYQEQQIATIRGASESIVIFSLSKEEQEFMQANTLEALKQLYDRFLNSEKSNGRTALQRDSF